MPGLPAAATKVGNQSLLPKIPLSSLPAGTWPGQRIMAGARKPPSNPIPLLPANGVMPPSGQENTSAPLSVLKTRMVLFSTPMSFRCFMTNPAMSSSCAIPASSVYQPFSGVIIS